MSTSSDSSASEEGCHGDGVIPTVSELEETYSHSKQLWEDLLLRVSSMGLKEDTVCPERLLYGVPHLPRDLENVTTISGLSTWDTTAKSSCDHPPPPRNGIQQEWKLSLPGNVPSICFLSNKSYFSGRDEPVNAIAPLCLAWSYVLCKALAERQGIPMHYSDLQTTQNGNRTPFVQMHIGKAPSDETRWWSALVASGMCGFRYTSSFKPPWTVSFSGNIPIHILSEELSSGDISDQTDTEHEKDSSALPSSSMAVEYISRFASLYGLNTSHQAMLALSIALTVPLHNQTKSVITLPLPHGLCRKNFRPENANANTGANTSKTTITKASSRITSQAALLSRYLTLSSNPLFLSSALWSVFWEPEIPSNRVSAWFAPIHDMVAAALSSEDEAKLMNLAHVMAFRRPTVSALWYGIIVAAAGGRRNQIFAGMLNYLKTAHTPWVCRPVPEVAVWTQSPQSFMDLSSTAGSYRNNDGRVKRADIWRLRYQLWNAETSEHCSSFFHQPPFCPWPPFGTMGDSEVELSIRPHLQCSYHELQYISWTWLLPGETKIIESRILPPLCLSTMVSKSGLNWTSEDSAIQQKLQLEDLDLTASQQSVSNIFRWSISEMEPSGKYIYSHPWVQACHDLDTEQEDGLVDGTNTEDLQERHNATREWLDKVSQA